MRPGPAGLSTAPVAALFLTPDQQLVAVNADGALGVHRWVTPRSEFGSFSFSAAAADLAYGVELDAAPKRLGAVGRGRRHAGAVALVPAARLVVTAGHWDHRLRCCALADGRVRQSLGAHRAAVTCLAVCGPAGPVVTGSRDTTVMVWHLRKEDARKKKLGGGGGGLVLEDRPRRVLYGHDAEVTCVAASGAADVVASGAANGVVVLHDLRRGAVVRGLLVPGRPPLARLAIRGDGGLVAYSAADLSLHAFTVNGRRLASAEAGERLGALAFGGGGGEFVVTGGARGVLAVRRFHDLRCVRRVDCGHGPITALLVTPEGCVVVGAEGGEVMLYIADAAKL